MDEPSALAVKRYELLTHLRFLGLTGPLAMQAVINTTEESIEESLTKARNQIQEKLK